MTLPTPNLILPASDHAVPQPLPLSKMDKRIEDGQVELVSGPAIPKLTFRDEQERVAARKRDYKSAISHKEDFHCPDCDAMISGKVAFKKHLKSVHQWLQRKIESLLSETPKIFRCPLCTKRFSALRYLNAHGRNKHKLSTRAFSQVRNPKTVVPEKPAPLVVSTDVARLLRANGINPAEISKDVRSELSPEVLAILSKGKPSRNGRIEGENITRFPAIRKPRVKPPRAPLEDCYESAMRLPIFQMLIPDDMDRRCFLLHHARGLSLRDIATQEFGTANKKRTVQTICDRALNQSMKWLKKAHREMRPESQDYAIYENLVNVLRGESAFETFELEIENYKQMEIAESDFNAANQIFGIEDDVADARRELTVRNF